MKEQVGGYICGIEYRKMFFFVSSSIQYPAKYKFIQILLLIILSRLLIFIYLYNGSFFAS